MATGSAKKAQKIKTFYDICKQEEALNNIGISETGELSFHNNQQKMLNQLPKLPYLQGFDLAVGLNSKKKTNNDTQRHVESMKLNTF